MIKQPATPWQKGIFPLPTLSNLIFNSSEGVIPE